MQQTFTNEVKTALGNGLERCDSTSLRLEKFTFLGDNSKLVQIQAVCAKSAVKKIAPYPLKGDKQFTLALGGRMMVNHAGGVLENAGLCLHRFFNYPMIPGSALKGVALHYAVQQWRKKVAEKEEVVRVFGYPTNIDEFDKLICPEKKERMKHARSGLVSFLPAVPADTSWKLVADVLNPHGGNDYTNPVPSFFTAVEKGAKFMFTLAKLSGATEDDLANAEKFLCSALCENGVGAKTVAGYGWFKNVEGGASIPTGVSETETYELTLVTPAFLGGADLGNGQDTVLRIPTLRGMLRWWWRTLYREFLDEHPLLELQDKIWGSTEKSSLIAIRVELVGNPIVKKFDYKDRFDVRADFAKLHGLKVKDGGLHYLAYGMNDGGRQRFYVEPGAKWNLHVSLRRNADDEVFDHFYAALSLLCTLGGIGSKSRKGFGSLYWADAWNDGECRDSAHEYCEKHNLPTRRDKAEYSLASAFIEDGYVYAKDPWKALDDLGIAVKKFVSGKKHCDEKAALGLPRKIHGPMREPLRHQSRATHRQPQELYPQGAFRNVPRFASPVWYHFTPDGQDLLLTVTAFPSGQIRDRETSESVLNDLLDSFK